MTRLVISNIEYNNYISRSNKLYIGNYFKLSGMHWRARKERQNFIVSVAFVWYDLLSKTLPKFNLKEYEISLSSFKNIDAKKIISIFFNIRSLGYKINDNSKSLTIVNIKKLSDSYIDSIKQLLEEYSFTPGPEPNNKLFTHTKIKIENNNLEYIKSKLCADGKHSLLKKVEWLYSHNDTINFYFAPSGKLKLRETSIWPIKAIETWPSWLRHCIFNTSVDIDFSYGQFIISYLNKKYSKNMSLLKLIYPDIVNSVYNKKQYRDEMCALLKLDVNEDNIKIVKSIIMSLANGSNISYKLLKNSYSNSETAKTVLSANSDLTDNDLQIIGNRLNHIAKQYKHAKKDICIYLGKLPTRAEVKNVMSLYFSWERDKRYILWKETNFTGINVHDGLEGVILNTANDTLTNNILEKYGLKVKVKSRLSV